MKVVAWETVKETLYETENYETEYHMFSVLGAGVDV